MAARTVPFGHDGLPERVMKIMHSMNTYEIAENIAFNHKTPMTAAADDAF